MALVYGTGFSAPCFSIASNWLPSIWRIGNNWPVTSAKVGVLSSNRSNEPSGHCSPACGLTGPRLSPSCSPPRSSPGTEQDGDCSGERDLNPALEDHRSVLRFAN